LLSDAAQERGEGSKQADNQTYSKAKKAGPSHIGLTAKAIREARDPRLGSARSRHRSAGVPVPELTRSVCIKLNKQVWL
jgi:hypothetical protein